MEVLVGQTQRNMRIFLSARMCLSTGNYFTVGKLCSLRTARLHGSVRFQSHAACENGPLTLSTLGFGNQVEVIKKGKNSGVERPIFSPRVRASKAHTPKLQEVEDKEVKDVKIQKKETSSKFRALNSAKLVSASKAKPRSKSKFKEGSTKKVLDMDSSVFAVKPFSELGLSPLLTKRLEEEGITVPTEVQSTAIPIISKSHDVVIQSYTGSGKTFAYLLPILSEIGPLKKPASEESESKNGIEAVVVAPSRELGMQIVREAEKLLGPSGRKCVQQLVGGANRTRQEEALRKNKPCIVVGTPGRIAEISASGKLHTHGCRFLVLDEVDQLLAFNFREDMHRILEHVGKKSGSKPINVPAALAIRAERQLIMVSATVPFSVTRAARSWGNDPLLVRATSVAPLESVSVPGTVPLSASDSSAASVVNMVTQATVDSLPPSLKHYYCVSKAQHKVDTLRRCIHALDAKSVIAFMNHTKQLRDVVFKLEARGINSAALHGDLGKLGRSTTLKNFKEGNVRVLVTNELSARGLDVFECDLVVNLDLPTDSVHYAHRAGRTGRLGQKGTVVTICEEPEVFVVNKLRRQLGVPIQVCEFTEGKLHICNGEEKNRSEAAVQDI